MKKDKKVEKQILPNKLKPIVKFNNGDGALLCNLCYIIIKTPLDKKEWDKKTSLVLCPKCIKYVVNNTETKYKEGFLPKEHMKLLSRFPTKYMNMDKYWNALHGITFMITDDGVLTYHCDIITALNCTIENRDMYLHEWD